VENGRFFTPLIHYIANFTSSPIMKRDAMYLRNYILYIYILRPRRAPYPTFAESRICRPPDLYNMKPIDLLIKPPRLEQALLSNCDESD